MILYIISTRNVSECPRWNDVLADVYNVEGNVWMQLNRPDSAILDYQKAYAYLSLIHISHGRYRYAGTGRRKTRADSG